MTDSDLPRPPRHTPGRYPSITDDDERDDLSVVTRNILAQLNENDRRRIKARMSITSSPPAAKVAGPILISVISAALFAVASAGVAMWRNDAVNAERGAQMSRWVQGLDADMREHNRAEMHAGARAAIAKEAAQLDALANRVTRIEAQLDAPRRPR